MVRQIITFILLSIFPLFCTALDIKFQVLQKGSGDPVENATVVAASSNEFVETNAGGIALLQDVQLPSEFKILSSGYETSIHKIERKSLESKNSPIKIYLVPIAFEGESLEVTAERVREKSSKIVLQADELRRAAGTQGDPLKAIQSLPGVVTAEEGTGLMYVRGNEPNQSIVWVNRARLGYLYHFGGLHSTISPQLVQDFNMFLGGFPVEYGDAMGGALDVRLRPPKNDRLHQNYSFGTYESSMVIEGPLFKKGGRDSGYFSARRSYIDLVLSPDSFSKISGLDDDGDSITQVPVFHDINAVWHRRLVNGDLRLQYFRAADSIELQLSSAVKSDPELVGALSSKAGYDSLSLIWNQNWSPRLKTLSSFYAIKLNQELSIGTDPLTGEPYHLKIDETDYVWQPELTLNVAKGHEIVLGAEVVYALTPVDAYISRPPAFNETEYNITELEKFRINRTYESGIGAVYAKWYGKYFDRLSLQLGGRATYLRSNGREPESIISPRSSFEFELTNDTVITGSWGVYAQYPDGVQWVEDAGNPKLQETKSEHRILGVRHHLSDVWNIQFESYHIPMWDLVKTNNTLSPPNNYSNDGTGQSYGFDFLIKRESRNGRMGWLSYSYLSSERTFDGVTVPFDGDQRHTMTAVWSQKLSGFMRKWNVGFRARINTGKPYTAVVGRTGICNSNEGLVPCVNQVLATDDPNFSHWSPDYAEKNSNRLPLFYQLDVRMDRQFLFNTWKMNMYIDVLNILNSHSITRYDYGSGFENIDNPTKVKSTGVFPSFGLEIEI